MKKKIYCKDCVYILHFPSTPIKDYNYICMNKKKQIIKKYDSPYQPEESIEDRISILNSNNDCREFQLKCN